MGYLCYRFTTPPPTEPVEGDPPPTEKFWLSGPTQARIEQHVADVLGKPGPYDVLPQGPNKLLSIYVANNGVATRLLTIFHDALINHQQEVTFLADTEWVFPEP